MTRSSPCKSCWLQSGIWVEPASAAGAAGLKQEIEAGRLDAKGKQVVVVCTGHGLKDPGIITRSFTYQSIPLDIHKVEELIGNE